jgi:hypothetical protein
MSGQCGAESLGWEVQELQGVAVRREREWWEWARGKLAGRRLLDRRVPSMCHSLDRF